MKIRLHWAEKFEMVREYPDFTLDTQKFPELELEIQHVYEAKDSVERGEALADLEYKMESTELRGETIMEIVGARDQCNAANVFNVPGVEEGFLKVSTKDINEGTE